MKAVKLEFDVEKELLVLRNEARSVKMSYSLRPNTDKRLRSLASAMNIPMSAIIDRALDLYMDALSQ